MAVMADKAELMEIVEQKELTIGQLSGETETIGNCSVEREEHKLNLFLLTRRIHHVIPETERGSQGKV